MRACLTRLKGMDFQDIGITGIISILTLVVTVIGFIKGLVRTVFALICLAIAGYAAFWAHENIDSNTASWIPKAAAAGAGVITYFICRYILKFIVDPFESSRAGERFGSGMPAALLSLCAGLAIFWGACTGIRYRGSSDELAYTVDLLAENQKQSKRSWFAESQQTLDKSTIGKWQQKVDPYHQPGQLETAKLLLLYHQKKSRAALLKVDYWREIVNNQDFLDIAYQEDIKQLAETQDTAELLEALAKSNLPAKSELVSKINSRDCTQAL